MTEDIFCTICDNQSVKKGAFITCSHCCLGFHKQCYRPVIPANVTKNWFCRRCLSQPSYKREMAKKQGNHLKNSSKKSKSNILNKTKVTTPKKRKFKKSEELNWNPLHLTNEEHQYCYCMNNGLWLDNMIQCRRCLQWFHTKCLKTTKIKIPLGDFFNIFFCTHCNAGKEFYQELPIYWPELVYIMMLTMLYKKENMRSSKYIDIEDELEPFMNKNWTSFRLEPVVAFTSLKDRAMMLKATLMSNPHWFGWGKVDKQKTTWWKIYNILPAYDTTYPFPKTEKPTFQNIKGYVAEISTGQHFDNTHQQSRIRNMTYNNNPADLPESPSKKAARMSCSSSRQDSTPAVTASPKVISSNTVTKPKSVSTRNGHCSLNIELKRLQLPADSPIYATKGKRDRLSKSLYNGDVIDVEKDNEEEENRQSRNSKPRLARLCKKPNENLAHKLKLKSQRMLNQKRKRGRPPKDIKSDESDSIVHIPIKKRGRPFKVPPVITLSDSPPPSPNPSSQPIIKKKASKRKGPPKEISSVLGATKFLGKVVKAIRVTRTGTLQYIVDGVVL